MSTHPRLKNGKIIVALLIAICLISATAIGIPNTIAKKESSKYDRKSDNPLLHFPVDEEKWLPIVPPEPVERPLDEIIAESVELLVYDVKTKKTITQSLTKPVKTTSKMTGYLGSLSSELDSGIPIEYGDRVRITPTTDYPWRTICKLFMYFPSSGWFMGSGFIIDDYHILTAGHCVYDPYDEEFATSIEVIPAMDDGYGPFYHAWAEEMAVTTDWANEGYITDDFAILTLDRNVGNFTGWMGLYTSIPSDPIYTSIVNTAGYPGDLDDGRNMYFDSDYGAGAGYWTHGYWMDTRGGQSGSPVWYYDDPDRYVLSIVTYETEPEYPNFGTRLNEYWFGFIDVIQGFYTPPVDYANLIDDGQDHSGFEPFTVAAGISEFDVWSDIRNIGTEDSGTFSVSYYASIDAEITASDYLIGVDEVTSITPFTWADSDWYGTFPNIPAGTYYVGWIIDSTDVVPEPLDGGEGNNVAYKDSYQLEVVSSEEFAITDVEDVDGNPISSGIKGDTVVVKGSGATSGAVVNLYWDYVTPAGLVNTTEANLDGTFEVCFNVPEAVNGTHYLWVKDTVTGQASAWGPFTVISTITLDVENGPVGTVVTVSGSGFIENGMVATVTIDGTSCTILSTTLLVNPPGKITGAFVIPGVENLGLYVITVTDSSGLEATSDFLLTGLAEIVVSPSYGAPGATITVSGSNFTQITGTEVTVTLDSDPVSVLVTAETDADGNFVDTFVSPALSFQTYTVTATDEYSVVATDDFKIGLIALIINPISGETGTMVSITGVGFAPGVYNLIFGDILYEEYGTVSGDESISDIFYVPNVDPGIYDVTIIDTDENELTVQFTVTTPIPPLPPELSNLVITPDEVELGDSVTISVDIENIDSQSFTYIVTMQIGEITILIDVELEPYESKTISHTITPDTVGVFVVTVEGLMGSFTVVTKTTISIGSAVIASGYTAEIPVNISHVTKIAGLGFELYWDPAVIIINGIRLSDDLPPSENSLSVGIDPGIGWAKVGLTNTHAPDFFTWVEERPVLIVEIEAIGLQGTFSILDLVDVEVSDPEWNPSPVSNVEDGLITIQNLGSIHGYVTYSYNGALMEGPTVELSRDGFLTITIKGVNGEYAFPELLIGEYTLTVSHERIWFNLQYTTFWNASASANVIPGWVTEVDFSLKIRGDLNDNGEVDIGDVAKIANMYVGNIPEEVEITDFNGDGSLDIGDVAKLANYYVRNIDEV